MSLPTRIARKARTYLQQSLDSLQAIPDNVWSSKEYDLIVLDDLYPYPLSAFRLAEYNYYLEHFKNSVVYTSGTAFSWIGETRSLSEIQAGHAAQHPELAPRVIRYNPYRKLRGNLAYLMFLHNAYQFLPVLTKNSLPFIFTLYPGGGFHLNHKNSDHMVRTVCNSPLLQKIIVTQKITYDYLVDNNFCRPEMVELIYGVVMPVETLLKNRPERKVLGQDKETFDVCFVAHKYMPRGVDKGYDTFVEVARQLSVRYANMHFHVVGSFTEADIDVSDLPNFHFYGPRSTAFFPDFYAGMEVIVSPNVPFMLEPGAFDGFPTGSCVEAALSGVAIFCSDELKQNLYFEHQQDIVLTTNEVSNITGYLAYYHDHYAELQQLAQRGTAKCQQVFSIDAQMGPRVQLITQELAEHSPARR